MEWHLRPVFEPRQANLSTKEISVSAEVEVPDLQSGSITRLHTRRLQTGCWTALIAVAVVRAWFTRYEFGGDSVSYMDIGRMIAEGHIRAAVHPYWSPGYPACLSFLWLLHPNSYWECPLAHFVNVLIFVGALAAFQLLWSEARLWHEKYAINFGVAIPESAFWVLGYAIFAVATLNFISVGLVHPDMLVAAFCFLSGWGILRFRRAPSAGCALLLGTVLSLGYYAKAPFFPIGFLFILCACLGRPVSRRRILLGGVALAAFLLTCAPFIGALSLAKGRFTFGESARLSQAFYINGVEHYVHWQGGPAGSGMPIHPTRKVNDFPEIYEFGAKNMGTYPPWFDPTYWYEGITPHANWKFQSKLFVANLILEFQLITDSAAMLICVAMILAMSGGNGRRWIRGLWSSWYIWAPGVMALLMFALVHVESRFLGGWLVLCFAGAVSACSLPEGRITGRTVGYIGLAALVTAAASVLSQASQEALRGGYIEGRSPRNAIIANYLFNHGLRPGDQVAVIGDGMYTYWAHLDRLHVVAEIPGATHWYTKHPAVDFWASGPEGQKHALQILAQTGAEAVVADPQGLVRGIEPSTAPTGWEKIGGIDTYVYFLKTSP